MASENSPFAPTGSRIAMRFSADKEVDLRARHYDDWTIECRRMDPQLDALKTDRAGNPPLWKDLTLASIVAAALWTAAAIIFS